MTADRRPGAGYQVALVALLSLNFGIVFFDRNALTFVMASVIEDLGLNDAQVGLLSTGLSLTWAASGLVFGMISDWSGRRKGFLIAATVVFSLASVLTGLASTYLMILGARMLMGLAEGSVMPLSQSLVAQAVAPRHRGLAMGSMQTTGAALLGTSLAPILVAAMAEAWGWRTAFFLAGVPGLVCALLMWVVIREPARPARDTAAPRARAGLSDIAKALLRQNIFVCAGISILLVAYMLITWTFIQPYLVQDLGLDGPVAGGVIATLGVSAVVFGALVPFVSDRIGRKPVMVLTPILGVILPLGMLYGGTSPLVLGAAIFVGYALAGTFAMFMATIPSETVPPGYIATSFGIVVGVGEVVGGLGPTIAGAASVAAGGREVIMWILFGLCLAASVLALALKETAPAALARRGGAAAPVAAA